MLQDLTIHATPKLKSSPRIEEARASVAEISSSDLYAAMVTCNIGFMQAMMTFDRDRIAQSLIEIDGIIEVSIQWIKTVFRTKLELN